MADPQAPRPPTVTPIQAPANPGPAATELPKITLPPETIRRWQEIVRQALVGGRDISVLVQQYAEQSFNTKLGSLDVQGARRRMLARAHAALEREHARAQTHLSAQPSVAPPIMTRSFQANVLEVPPASAAPPAPPAGRNDKKVEIEWHHTTTSPDDPYTKRVELEAHMQKLVVQMQAIDKELPTIDAVLNKGLRNQQNVVLELAAVSRELYRLAQEVHVEPQQKRTPTDGTGYQKSVKKKEAGPSSAQGHAAADGGPSHPGDAAKKQVADAADAGSSKAVRKTVPINPLVPASKHLARVIGQASTKTSQVASSALTPVGQAVSKGSKTVADLIAATLGKIGSAVSSAISATWQTLKDIWPWRGPPPE